MSCYINDQQDNSVCFPANHCPIATCEKSVPVSVICKASVVPIVLSMDQKLSKELDLRNPPFQREQCYKVITNLQGPCGRMLMLPVWGFLWSWWSLVCDRWSDWCDCSRGSEWVTWTITLINGLHAPICMPKGNFQKYLEIPQRREDETNVADSVTMCGRVALPAGGSGRLVGVFDVPYCGE